MADDPFVTHRSLLFTVAYKCSAPQPAPRTSCRRLAGDLRCGGPALWPRWHRGRHRSRILGIRPRRNSQQAGRQPGR